MKIVVFGDSILKGVITIPNSGKLFDVTENDSLTLAQKKLGFELDNRSIYGNITSKGLIKLQKFLEKGETADFCIIEFGSNDCDYDWAAIAENPDGRHHCKTPPELFAACYREAIALIRSSGRIPVALTLPPILSERYLNFICSRGISKEKIVSWLGDIGAISRRQKTYSELVTLVAREEQAELIDLRRAFPEEETDLERCICADGIHPSAAGQELIYRALRTYARPV